VRYFAITIQVVTKESAKGLSGRESERATTLGKLSVSSARCPGNRRHSMWSSSFTGRKVTEGLATALPCPCLYRSTTRCVTSECSGHIRLGESGACRRLGIPSGWNLLPSASQSPDSVATSCVVSDTSGRYKLSYPNRTLCTNSRLAHMPCSRGLER
jgi:hypothetical protein